MRRAVKRRLVSLAAAASTLVACGCSHPIDLRVVDAGTSVPVFGVTVVDKARYLNSFSSYGLTTTPVGDLWPFAIASGNIRMTMPNTPLRRKLLGLLRAMDHGGNRVAESPPYVDRCRRACIDRNHLPGIATCRRAVNLAGTRPAFDPARAERS